MKYKNVLFDLDGTLTDPAEGITNALMHAQRRLGRPVSPREDLFVFIGPPLIETFMSEWGLSREESHEFKASTPYYNNPPSGFPAPGGKIKDVYRFFLFVAADGGIMRKKLNNGGRKLCF